MRYVTQVTTALYLLICAAVQANAEPEGVEHLAESAAQWVADNQSIHPDQVTIRTPDRRARIVPCATPLEFQWPFSTSQRTLQASCADPQWRYFLQVEIMRGIPAVVLTHTLAAGTRLTAEDLKTTQLNAVMPQMISKPEQAIGKTLLQAVKEGQPLTRLMLDETAYEFVTTQAYSRGETIRREQLTVRPAQARDQSALTVWPLDPVITTQALPEGHTVLQRDIERSAMGVVSSVTIIRNQVITSEMVQLSEMPNTKLSAQPLTSLAAVIGFEATRTIPAGSPVTRADLREADLVRQGENVTLTITRGSLAITVDVIASENGKLGEQVVLINPESGREIRGIVTGRNQVSGL